MRVGSVDEPPRAQHPAADYGEAALAAALRAAGIRHGDLVFTHVSLEALGIAEDCPGPLDTCAMFMRAVRSAVGESGTIMAPSYTFSFARQEPFDVERSPAIAGSWSHTGAPASRPSSARRVMVRCPCAFHAIAGEALPTSSKQKTRVARASRLESIAYPPRRGIRL